MNPWALVSLGALIVLCGLCLFVYRRRPPHPLWPSLFFALFFPLIFSAGNFGRYFTDDPTWSWMCLAIIYSAMMFVAPANFILVHRYAEAMGKGFAWGHSKWVWAPVPITLLMWFGMITNPWHELFLIPHVGERSEFKILWIVHIVFAYALSITALWLYFVLLRRVRSAQQRYRVLVMAASIVALVGNALFFVPALRVPFDPTTVGFAIAGVLYLLSIYPKGAYPVGPFVLTSILRRQSLGLVLTDAQGHISFWNDAAEETLGESLGGIDEPFYAWLAQRLAHVEEVDGFQKRMLDQLRLTPAPAITWQVLELNSQPGKWIRMAVYPIADRRGKQVDSLSFQIEDYTRQHLDELERDQIQVELEEHQKQEGLSVLASGIAHDFNNILAAIQGSVELALSEASADAPLQSRLEIMADATQRGARLTQQLLAYAGKSTPQRSRIELHTLVGGITELLGTITKSRGLYLHTSSERSIDIHADRGQIEQVIMNLTLNAVEASTTGDSIFLSAGVCDESGQAQASGSDVQEGFAFISVRDEGSGIDLEARERIFDPFFTTKKEGRGLGLAAVRGIVRSHGGKLSVRSNRGDETEFKVVFPRYVGAADTAEESSATDVQDSLLILVVDDELAVGHLCCEMLRAAGCNTLFAASGAEAISIFERQRSEIHLVVLDIAMPDIDGIAVFKKIRSLDPSFPVVFVSGHPSNILPKEIADSGQLQFLNKPYTGRQLNQAVNMAVQ